jgi:hypothetical protein
MNAPTSTGRVRFTGSQLLDSSQRAVVVAVIAILPSVLDLRDAGAGLV